MMFKLTGLRRTFEPIWKSTRTLSSLPKPPSGPLAPLPPAPSDDNGNSLSRPGPLPLGNPKDQAEYQTLLRENAKREALDGASGKRHPDAPAPAPNAFEGDKNPKTGEIGGPKGDEPTRYGDWERNGRVFDF